MGVSAPGRLQGEVEAERDAFSRSEPRGLPIVGVVVQHSTTELMDELIQAQSCLGGGREAAHARRQLPQRADQSGSH